MDYTQLPGKNDEDTKKPLHLILILLAAVCFLGVWNTWLTMAQGKIILNCRDRNNGVFFLPANNTQIIAGLQKELMESYLQTIFHALHNR